MLKRLVEKHLRVNSAFAPMSQTSSFVFVSLLLYNNELIHAVIREGGDFMREKIKSLHSYTQIGVAVVRIEEMVSPMGSKY